MAVLLAEEQEDAHVARVVARRVGQGRAPSISAGERIEGLEWIGVERGVDARRLRRVDAVERERQLAGCLRDPMPQLAARPHPRKGAPRVPATGRPAQIETEVEGHTVEVVVAQMTGTLPVRLAGRRAPEGRPELGVEREHGAVVAGRHGRHELADSVASCVVSGCHIRCSTPRV